MSNIRHANTLHVWRTLSSGRKVLAGQLARNSRGQIYFSYAQDYLSERLGSLSPFMIPYSPQLIPGPSTPWQGLHGVFADSLPDGWGLLLQGRALRSRGIDTRFIQPLDRLALVGKSGIGALSYEPAQEIGGEPPGLSILSVGREAERVLCGDTEVILPELLQSGASGGSRPKALLYLSKDAGRVSTRPFPGSTAWLVKFTSRRTPLGHEEGLAEAAVMTLATRAGINVAQWRLFAGAEGPDRPRVPYWFGTKRFDCTGSNETGRWHRVSAAGLLDADFRTPSLDYLTLMQATRSLTKSAEAAEEQVRRVIFNWFIQNQDDHARNFSFLQSDEGDWRLSPAYDLTYSPTPYGEHETALCGCGKILTAAAVKRFAAVSGIPLSRLKLTAQAVINAVAGFAETARELGLSKARTQEISRALEAARKELSPAFGITTF